MNKVILMGNLTREPEVRVTPSGKSLTTASLATNKKWKDDLGVNQEKAEFHNLVVWNGSEAFAKYLTKGSKVLIEGELQTDTYQDKETGKKRYSTKIHVNKFHFLDSKLSDNNIQKQVNEKHPFTKDKNNDEEINIESIPF